jgi:outer membrane protein
MAGRNHDDELLMLVKNSYLSFCLASCLAVGVSARVSAQTAPLTPGHPWTSPYEQQVQTQNQSLPAPKFAVDPIRSYSLPELVDLAEQHNPETRFAWERAKAQAAALGIARSEWYPVLGAIAAGDVGRQALLIDTNFLRQTVSTSDLAVELNYKILDFGRSARIQLAAAQLLATDFGFNDTHRRIVFQVEEAYYRVLSTASQEQAAEANLANAQAVQQAAQERLDHGLATRPDLLEAQSATAQAQFDLQSAIGAQEIARGDLAAALGTSATVAIRVEPVTSLTTPDSVEDSVEQLITRALQQRPDLLQQVADLRAREAAVKQAKAAYYPTLNVGVVAGQQYLYGFQEQFPAVRTSLFAGTALASLNWTIFDGGARRNAVTQAEANSRAASAQIDSTRNQIADEVWRAYSNVKTAFRQREAATALLKSAEESYNAALEAYNYGVRNLLDVTAAQRALAQARTADISAQTQVLTTLADLAFRTGDLLHITAKSGKP